MVDNNSAVAVAVAEVLHKTDPFALDVTIKKLVEATATSLSSASSALACSHLPLVSNAGGKGNDEDENRPFLETSFNRISDNDNDNSYRSPWKQNSNNTNTNPNTNDDDLEVLELEQSANEVWDAYRQLYYGHDAIGSVFVRRKGGGSNSDASSSSSSSPLEALFGIQKKLTSSSEEEENENGEYARWESVHTVTIEAPNFDDNTCEYKIESMVWCRYQPQPNDVGDVPVPVVGKTKKKKVEAPKKTTPKKKKNGKVLDISRLEMFDKAANNWDSQHTKNGSNKAPPVTVPKGPPPPPIPAVVTSSAVYTKDTVKVCRLSLLSNTNNGGGKNNKSKNTTNTASSRPSQSMVAKSHIQNIGSLLEKIETDFRSKFERVEAPKCIEILQGMSRPSLSPGLKMSNGTSSGSSMISRLGGHASGMGVGKGLIGEIALKAKSKGLGGDSSSNGDGSGDGSGGNNGKGNNKAMECILAAEKKKLRDNTNNNNNNNNNSTTTPDWKANLKKSPVGRRKMLPEPSSSSSTSSSSSSSSSQTPDWKAGLKKSPVGRRKMLPDTNTAAASPTPAFMNFRSKLKSTPSGRQLTK